VPKIGSWEALKLGKRNLWPIAHRRSTNSTNATNQTNKTNKTEPSVRSTFFVLGWIAERLPHLVREIHKRGHEVASHGYGHEMCNQQSSQALKADLIKSKTLLEDIIGEGVHGYRAPSFSVDNDILQIIQEAGYRYDSSFNSWPLRQAGNQRFSTERHRLPGLRIVPRTPGQQPFSIA
jgi:alpha-amylase/alpha-mannosidase (GH57 family)